MKESYYIAFDLGGTYLKYAFINAKNDILNKYKIKSPQNIDDLLDVIHDVLINSDYPLKGVGFSVPGAVDVETGTIYFGGSHPYLHEVSLKKIIEEKYDIKCVVSNDGKSAAATELWLGNLRDVKNGAVVLLGTGVGGGIIINGNILQGSNYQAGELSFMLRESEDNLPFMGLSASAVKFTKEASILLNLKNVNDGEKVFESIISNNNPALNRLFENYCKEVSNIILNLQAILDISKVVIGGGISAQQILIEGIRSEYKKRREKHEYLQYRFPEVEIEDCAFKNDSNLLGAIYPFFA